MFLIVGISSLVYGALSCSRLFRNQRKRDARLLLLLCIVVSLYFMPFSGPYMPTVESLYQFVYSPISEYALRLLQPGIPTE